MIDINKIPGFKETPDEIHNLIDCNKIMAMAKIPILTSQDAILICTRIKKLLDDRRGLLKNLIKILKHHEKPYLHKFDSGGIVSFVKLGDIYAESAFNIIEEITGKTWEELNE